MWGWGFEVEKRSIKNLIQFIIIEKWLSTYKNYEMLGRVFLAWYETGRYFPQIRYLCSISYYVTRPNSWVAGFTWVYLFIWHSTFVFVSVTPWKKNYRTMSLHRIFPQQAQHMASLYCLNYIHTERAKSDLFSMYVHALIINFHLYR